MLTFHINEIILLISIGVCLNSSISNFIIGFTGKPYDKINILYVLVSISFIAYNIILLQCLTLLKSALIEEVFFYERLRIVVISISFTCMILYWFVFSNFQNKTIKILIPALLIIHSIFILLLEQPLGLNIHSHGISGEHKHISHNNYWLINIALPYIILVFSSIITIRNFLLEGKKQEARVKALVISFLLFSIIWDNELANTFHFNLLLSPIAFIFYNVLISGRQIVLYRNFKRNYINTEQKFKDLTYCITDMYFALDNELKYIFWNKACENFTKVSHETVFGKTWNSFEFNKQIKWLEEIFKNVIESRTSQSIEVPYLNQNTEYIFKVNVFPSTNGIVVYIHDITENKQLERSLLDSESKFKLLFENTGTNNVFVDVDGNEIFCNNNFQKYKEELFKSVNDNIEDAEIYSTYMKTIAECIEKRDIVEIETDLVLGKKQKWYNSTYIPIYNDRNEIIGIQIISKDITEEKELEIALKESEEKYRLLSDLNSEGIVIHEDGYVIELNKALCDIYGYEAHELIGRNPLKELLTAESYEKAFDNLKNKNTKSYVVEGIRKDGKIIHIEVQGFETKYKNRDIRISRVRDISNQILTQRQLENTIHKYMESEKRYKTLSESSKEGIVIHTNGNVWTINTAFENIFGYTSNEIVHTNPVKKIFTPESSEIVSKNILNNNLKPYIVEAIHKSGKHIWVEIEAINDVYFKKDVRISLVRDVTEKKETAKKIMSAIIEAEEKERNYFSKELHDGLGPVLSSLNMYFEWLSKTDNSQEKEMILNNGFQNINEALEIVEEISNKLTPRTLNSFGLSAAIETFVGRLKKKDSVSFDFRSNFKQRLPIQLETTIYRVITELINNTLKHANASVISINMEYIAEKELFFVQYIDNGIGFNYKEKILSNNGLGLVNIHERIQTFNGTVHFKSLIDFGTEVKILFKNIVPCKTEHNERYN